MDVIYGKHSVRAVFAARPGAIRRLLLREGAARYLDEFVDLAREIGVEPEFLATGEFLRIGGLDADDKHQGVFVLAEPRRVKGEHDLDDLAAATTATVLALDQISNPQNFGTILRTAAFFGIDGVLWVKKRAADLDATVHRVAVGGVEYVDLYRVPNLARAMQRLQNAGFWVYGLDERGDRTIYETDFDAKRVLVTGAENEGLRRRTRELCDHLVSIPGGRPGLESLNASVATAVALAEIARQG